MSDLLSSARISRREVLLGGTLSLVAALWGLSACGEVTPSPTPTPAPDPCEGSTPSSSDTVQIEFLYSTEKDAWLQQAMKAFKQTNLQCNRKPIQIIAHDSGSVDIVDQIVNQKYPYLVACSPASELELSRLNFRWKSTYKQSIVNYTTEFGPQSLIQSPLVFAIWKEFADALRKHFGRIDWDTLSQALQLPNGWQDLGLPQRGPQIHLGQTVPTESNSGLMAITLMACAYLRQHNKSESLLTAKEVMQDSGLWEYLDVFESHVNVYGKSSGTYWERVIELGPAQYAVVLTYESLVLLYGKRRRPEQPQMEMFYPEQNVLNDHPFAILDNTRLADQLQEQQYAAKAFRDFLLTDKNQQKAALKYGFRPSDSTQPLVDPGENDPDNPFDQLKPTDKFSSLSPAHALDTGINYINALGGDVADDLITEWQCKYPNPNVI